jgi:hypothetical protein
MCDAFQVVAGIFHINVLNETVVPEAIVNIINANQWHLTAFGYPTFADGIDFSDLGARVITIDAPDDISRLEWQIPHGV